MAEIQFSETMWWISVVMSFHSPNITFCWNGENAYTTTFIRTGVFPIVPLPPRLAFLLLSCSDCLAPWVGGVAFGLFARAGGF